MNWPTTPASPRRNKAVGIAISTAIAAMFVALTALIVSIIVLTHSAPTPDPAARPSSPSTTPAAPGASPTPPPPIPADYKAANKALCTAVVPLMAENDRIGRSFTSLGPPDSAASAAGVAKFVSDTKDWVTQIQPIVDNHPAVEPYLHRMLQRFVDDQKSLALDLAAGPWQAYDQTIWNDGLGAENGPMSTCWALGVKW